jgi:hypothetical protein
MVSFDTVAAVAGGALAVGSFGVILARALAPRRHVADLRLEFEDEDGAKRTFNLNLKDAAQAEQLAQLLLEDEMVSVGPEKDDSQDKPDKPDEDRAVAG